MPLVTLQKLSHLLLPFVATSGILQHVIEVTEESDVEFESGGGESD